MRETNTLTLAESKFKYQNKERDTETGYDYFEARMYDSQLGRFMQVDPLADIQKHHIWNAYHMSSDNPINRVDPTGMVDTRLGPNEDPSASKTGVHAKKNSSSQSVSRKNNSITVLKSETNSYGEFNKKGVIKGSATNISQISNKSAKTIFNSMQKAAVSTVAVTSTTRTPYDQAKAMYDNIQTKGIDSQKSLYSGKPGEQVIETYVTASNSKTSSQESVLGEMTVKINELGPSNVSRHCGDNSVLNVIDIAPSSINNPQSFHLALHENPGINKVITPFDDSGEGAFHVEIPQN